MSGTHVTAPARAAGMRLPLSRRGLMIAAFAVIAAGMALNWSWLTAVGAAPLILSLAPCAATCALGLCMRGGACKNKTSGGAGATQD